MEPAKEQESESASVQAKPEASEASEVPSEMSAMVSLLASSVHGIQGSLGNAYQSLANQLQQSMEMTQAMSGMMDLLLVSNLNISSSIEHDEETDKPLLIIETQNKSPFPLSNIVGTIRIESDRSQQTHLGHVTGSAHAIFVSSTVGVIKRGETELNEMPNSIYKQIGVQQKPEEQSREESTDASSAKPIDVLLPGMRCMDIFELNLGQFDNWIILIEISLKSPGTGKKLFKRHELCVYLLDQCAINWFPDDGVREPDQSSSASMMMTPFRHVLKVPVTDGVSVGMRFSMIQFQNEFKVQGYVSGISEDRRVAQIRFWCDELSSHYDLDILQLLQKELSILGEHVHSAALFVDTP